MLQGQKYIYRCPKCEQLLYRRSLLSGNTFGSILYSDGKRVSPMNPAFPDLTKCKRCNEIFMMSDLESVGKYRLGENIPPAWQDADEAEFLSIADYHRAIETEIADELMLREHLWQAYNDRIRNGQEIFQDKNDELLWEDNIRKFLSMLDINIVNERIVLAEILRNLGEFDECIRMITSIEDSSLGWLKDKFIAECRVKNRWLIELN